MDVKLLFCVVAGLVALLAGALAIAAYRASQVDRWLERQWRKRNEGE